jgi:hypothetical protein
MSRPNYRWLDELPRDEQQLWQEAIQAAGPAHRNPPPCAGDWIPLGHVPLELIPEPDYGPLQTFNVARWTAGR